VQISFLHPKPGTDLVWLSAITRYLLDNGQADTKFLEQWVNGLEQLSQRPLSLSPWKRPLSHLRPASRNSEDCGTNDRRSKEYVRSLGDGK